MKRLAMLAALATMVACVSTQATLLNPSPVKRAPVPADQVRIYRTPDQVVGRYEEIALLHAQGETEWTNEKTMLESMRRKAGKVGANGLILDSIREAGAVEQIAGAVLKTGSTRRGRAVAIFVFPDSTAGNP
jgi:hypothetical protein